MRSASLVAALLLFFSAAWGADGGRLVVSPGSSIRSEKPHLLTLCRTASQSPDRHGRWARETNEAFGGFFNSLASLNNKIELRTVPIAQCPRQVEEGCYSQSGNIYCSDIVIERVLFALALLLEMAQRPSFVSALDKLGTTPFTAYEPFNVVDSLLFPKWWESYQFRFSSFAATNNASTWLATARSLHDKEGDRTYREARGLVVGFVLGHETFHAFGNCPLADPSYAETSGYLENAVALQQNEYWCPSPPDNVEVNADACGLRWLEFTDRALYAAQTDTTSAKLARAAAALTLQQLFNVGLRVPPKTRTDWQASRYLYPYLRTAIVHRTLYHLGGGEPRVGICNDALRVFWDTEHKSTLCVTRESGSEYNVLLTPKRQDGGAWDLFPSIELEPGKPRPRPYCLSGTSQLPRPRALGRGTPTVSIRITALKPEAREQSVSTALESAQKMLDRPHIYSALSACMPGSERERRFALRYTAKGQLDEVRGENLEECRCVHEALKDLTFSDSLHYAPIDPAKPYKEPGYVMTLEIRQKEIGSK